VHSCSPVPRAAFGPSPVLWLRAQYFARAFQNMRNTFLNTVVAVIRDVWPFLLLLLMTLWGFAGALLAI